MKKLLLGTLILLAPMVGKAQDDEGHRFWDRTNVYLHLMNATAHSLDAYSTQSGLRNGAREANPLAAPFANRGWKGQIVASYGFGVGGTLAASYLFHRMGNHRWERFTPILVATPTAIAAGFNFRF